MGYTRYPSSGGNGVSTYANQAALPAGAADGTAAITTDTHTLWIYDAVLVQWVAVANENTVPAAALYNNYRSAHLGLASNISQIAVNFSTALTDNNYALEVSIENTADSSPIFLQPIIIGRFAYGFTVSWNALTDTSNYTLHYIATQASVGAAGRVGISQNATSASVTFSPALASSNYALDLSIENSTDTSPIFLQTMITARSVNGFTATLNAAADTANYILHYTVRGAQ